VRQKQTPSATIESPVQAAQRFVQPEMQKARWTERLAPRPTVEDWLVRLSLRPAVLVLPA